MRLQIYRRYIEFVSRQSSAAAKQEHHRSNSQPQDQGQQSPTSGTEAPRRRSRLEIHTEPPMPHIRVTARDPPSSSAAALPVTSTSSPTSTVLQKGADLSNSRESQGRVLDPAVSTHHTFIKYSPAQKHGFIMSHCLACRHSTTSKHLACYPE